MMVRMIPPISIALPLGAPEFFTGWATAVLAERAINLSKGKVSGRTYYQLNANSVEGTRAYCRRFITRRWLCANPIGMRRSRSILSCAVGCTIAWLTMTCVWSLAIWRCFGADCRIIWTTLPLIRSTPARIFLWCIFFRLRLPGEVQRRLIAGSTLLIKATDASDVANFPRWDRYNRSGDPLRAQQAVSELLLRLERVRFEPFQLVPASKMIFLRLKLRSNFRPAKSV